ncbi:hypothetical protein EON68_01345, partial [archaeon]
MKGNAGGGGGARPCSVSESSGHVLVHQKVTPAGLPTNRTARAAHTRPPRGCCVAHPHGAGMEGDGGEEYGIGFDADWGVTSACHVCGSTAVTYTDVGEQVCLDCGTQSQDVRQLTTEAMQTEEERKAATATRKRASYKAAAAARTALPSAVDAFNTRDFVQAAQIVLQSYATTCIQRCGMPPSFFSVVGDLWFHYLARWRDAGVPIAHIIHGRFVTAPNPLYFAKLRVDGMTPAPCVPFTLSLLVSILVAAARRLCLPFVEKDFVMWLENGTLPYLDAHSLLPADLRVILTAAAAFFAPTHVPTAARLARLTIALAHNVGAELPPPNIPALIVRNAHLAGLPPAAATAALQLYDLHVLDEEQLAVYAEHAAQGGGGGAGGGAGGGSSSSSATSSGAPASGLSSAQPTAAAAPSSGAHDAVAVRVA